MEASLEGLSLEERGERAEDTLMACAEEFTAQGVDLAGYNSNENAADVDAIRQAMGYDKIVYYGESYGTLLGQFVMRNHPEILESIILDGIVPASAVRVSDISRVPGAFRTVFDACAADEQCNAAYPDLEAVLAEGLEKLRENPAQFTMVTGAGGVPLVIDDLLAMNVLFIHLYLPNGYATLPAIVYALRDGDLRVSTWRCLRTSRSPVRRASCTLPSTAATTRCSRWTKWALTRCSPSMQAFRRKTRRSTSRFCAALDLPRLPDVADEVVQSDLPALLLQGGMDPATPVAGGDNVATGLPNSTMVVVPAGTHVQGSNPCALQIARAFMNDPQSTPDTSCVNPNLPFASERSAEAEGGGQIARLPFAPLGEAG